MKQIFSLFILKDNRYDVSFFRTHVVFFTDLLVFITKNKFFFLRHPSKLYTYFNTELSSYLENNNIPLLHSLFLQVLRSAYKVYHFYVRELFSYIMKFILMFLEKGYYSVAFISIASFLNYDEEKIREIFMLCSKKYKINAKLVIISINSFLKKGILVEYRNSVIDFSLRKLIYKLNESVDLQKAGEIVYARRI